MAGQLEATKCHCGQQMVEAVGPGMVCPNCDNVQRQEAGLHPRERRKTVSDIRFDAYWLEQMAEYEDNTPPEPTDTLCEDCEVEGHESCSLTPGCPCCDDTIHQMEQGETT